MDNILIIAGAGFVICFIAYKLILMVFRLIASSVKRAILFKIFALGIGSGTGIYYSTAAFVSHSVEQYGESVDKEYIANSKFSDIKDSYMEKFSNENILYKAMAMFHSEDIEKKLGILHMTSPDVPSENKKSTYLNISYLLDTTENLQAIKELNPTN